MIEVRNAKGGVVNIYHGLLNEGRDMSKRWIKRWRMFGLTFAVSNCRVKMREPSKMRWHYAEDGQGASPMMRLKRKVYSRTEGRCEICGKPIDYKYSQLHHVLPYSRMGQFATDERNVLLLCHDCHQEIHSNPLKQVEMMQKKADELGVDLKDFYDYGNIGSGKA